MLLGFKLRAFSQDTPELESDPWVRAPTLPNNIQVSSFSTEFVTETLNYFVDCKQRLYQMTKTYDDNDAYLYLLQEKEVDLELVARIGQDLLKQNKNLKENIERLEQELSERQDDVQQLKHDLNSKITLLDTFIQEEEQQDQQSVTALRQRVGFATDSESEPAPVRICCNCSGNGKNRNSNDNNILAEVCANVENTYIYLLKEKEVDLEMAAKLGQDLLKQNKNLKEDVERLQQELAESQDMVQQLKHELNGKIILLDTFIREEEQHHQELLKNRKQAALNNADDSSKTHGADYIESGTRLCCCKNGSNIDDEDNNNNDINKFTSETSQISSEEYNTLLREKEFDLEFVARIAQDLLQQNIQLKDNIERLGQELCNRQDSVRELDEELNAKINLLDLLIKNDCEGDIGQVRSCEKKNASSIADREEKSVISQLLKLRMPNSCSLLEELQETMEKLRGNTNKRGGGKNGATHNYIGSSDGDATADECDSGLHTYNSLSTKASITPMPAEFINDFESDNNNTSSNNSSSISSWLNGQNKVKKDEDEDVENEEEKDKELELRKKRTWLGFSSFLLTSILLLYLSVTLSSPPTPTFIAPKLQLIKIDR